MSRPKGLRVFIVLWIVTLHRPISDGQTDRFITWDIGQGLWTTTITATRCDHIDVGGEWFVSGPKLRTLCRERASLVHFSHWDLDHINLIKHLKTWLPHSCIATSPRGTAKLGKQLLLSRVPHCGTSQTSESASTSSAVSEISIQTSFLKKGSNEISRIFISAQNVIVPGDSPSGMEKIWAVDLPKIAKPILLLGHHGSQTSTSESLLHRLGAIRAAIASSRQAKYGHPHFSVRNRLRQHHVPLLRTEDWGNLIFQLPQRPFDFLHRPGS